MNSIYDDVDFELSAYRRHFTLAPEFWKVFNIDDLPNADFTKWQTFKLTDETGTRFSDNINKVPDDVGGIYVYCIQPSIIPQCGSYIMYIGMTSQQSLRTRVNQYQREIGDKYKRDRIHNLFVRWGKYIYLYFLPVIDTKENIEILEDRLIATLLPPCNPEIRVKSVRKAVRAFD